MTAEPVFCLVYRWRVHAGREAEFCAAWTAATHLIRDLQGSLGSRLHRADDGTYVAYAQWPHRRAWDQSDQVGSSELDRHRAILRDCAERLLPDLHLELVVDAFATAQPLPESP